jgi:hypothetical protein
MSSRPDGCPPRHLGVALPGGEDEVLRGDLLAGVYVLQIVNLANAERGNTSCRGMVMDGPVLRLCAFSHRFDDMGRFRTLEPSLLVAVEVLLRSAGGADSAIAFQPGRRPFPLASMTATSTAEVGANRALQVIGAADGGQLR